MQLITIVLSAGFEKEISSPLKNLEARKGLGVKVSGERRKHFSASHLRGNYVSLSAQLTTTVLHTLSGENGGALRTQLLCCEVVVLFLCC